MPILTLTAFAIIGASAYIWCTRGFFSALLHLMCVFAAGAIAFGVWEPLSYFLLRIAPERGFGAFLTDMPFALGLVTPFVVSLLIIRSVVDKLLPANAQCDSAMDYIGGGVCGVMAGIITAGIAVISVNYLRVKPDFGGYQPVVFSGATRGSPEMTTSKFIPWADRLTAALYENLSLTTLRTGEPLAKYYPDVVAAGAANRLTYEGKGRTGLKSDAVNLVGWYTIGDFNKAQKFDDLSRDIRSHNPQKVADLSGDPITQGAVVGYIVKFASKAREGSGQVVVGNGQLRLICEPLDGSEDYKTVFPFAVVSRVNDPAEIRYARFRFDSDDFYISSVGGESEAVLGFEFPVPENYRPQSLYVKNIRIPVTPEVLPKPDGAFSQPLERDATIAAGQFKAWADHGTPIIDPATGKQVERPQEQQFFVQEPVQISSAIGFTIQKGTEQGLQLVKKERGGWQIQNGEMKIAANKIAGFGGLERNLQIAEFQVNEDTVMVQVDITPRHREAEITRALEAASRNEPILLLDTDGKRYEAVGFIYEDNVMKWIRYTRGYPLKNLNETNPVTQNSPPDRKLRLLFTVSRGVTVDQMRIGESVIQSNIALDTSTATFR